jgi:hypothetical protein
MKAIFLQVVLAMQMVRLYSLLLEILIFLLVLLWVLRWVLWVLLWVLKVRALLREVVVP